MNGKIVGLVIRTVFNNQGWKEPCKNPLKDYRCFKCVEGGGLYINKGNPIEEDEKGFCKGNSEGDPKLGEKWCWEQGLCTKYFWKNIKGKWRYVNVGMPVYFVYSERDGSLTLWGRSVIDKVNNEFKYSHLYFKPFEPMPQDKWVKGLNGEELTGNSWRQLHYRYLDEKHENFLSSLIKGVEKIDRPNRFILSSGEYEIINFQIRRDIKEKLAKIADKEGREVSDVIREALAKLIRDRGFKY